MGEGGLPALIFLLRRRISDSEILTITFLIIEYFNIVVNKINNDNPKRSKL